MVTDSFSEMQSCVQGTDRQTHTYMCSQGGGLAVGLCVSPTLYLRVQRRGFTFA